MTVVDAPTGFRLVQSVQYGKVPGGASWEGRLYLDLLLPEAQSTVRPAVVYIHGGGWAEGSRADGLYPWLCPLLAAHGFVAATVTHRLSRSAAFPAQIHDVKAAIRFLRANAEEYRIDPARIGVWGDSTGGHLAALLGTSVEVPELEGDCGSPGQSSRVQAVIARCAPADFHSYRVSDDDWRAEVFYRFFGGPIFEHEDLAHLASPVSHVRSGVPPFLIVHGTRDETVPYRQALTLADALRAHRGDVTLNTIDGAYHNLLPDLDAAWGNEPWTALGYDALEFFTRHLTTPDHPKDSPA